MESSQLLFCFCWKNKQVFWIKGIIKIDKNFHVSYVLDCDEENKENDAGICRRKRKQEDEKKHNQNKDAPEKKKQINRSWGIEEKEAVLLHFSSDSRSQHVPGKKREDCLEVFPCLKSRSWKDVKYWVKNRIDRIKKTKQ